MVGFEKSRSNLGDKTDMQAPVNDLTNHDHELAGQSSVRLWDHMQAQRRRILKALPIRDLRGLVSKHCRTPKGKRFLTFDMSQDRCLVLILPIWSDEIADQVTEIIRRKLKLLAPERDGRRLIHED